MEGWVDQDTRRWKPPTGSVTRLATIDVDRLACPACKAQGSDDALWRTPGEPFWLCASGHIYECALLPE